MKNTKKSCQQVLPPLPNRAQLAENQSSCASFVKHTAPKSRQLNLTSFPRRKQQEQTDMPRIYIDFKPAQIVDKKETYVSYYVLNPFTGKMERKRVRLNHIRNKKERLKYARHLCNALNERLYAGWNPFFEELPNSCVTIRDALATFLTAKAKTSREATMRSYRSFASLLTEWLKLQGTEEAYCVTFTADAVRKYLSWIDATKNLSNRSYNNYCMFLYTLFDFFVNKGYMTGNPADGMPRRKVDKKERTIIPKEDRAVIRAWFQERVPRYVPLMLLCYSLFVRPKEICELRICNIDFDNRMLRIPSFVAKNHRERVLGVPEELMAYFRTLKEYPDTYYIFADRNTYEPGPKAMSSTRIAEMWSVMRDEMKLPASYQFYSLKDTGITEMLEAGVPAKYVKELADHHSLEMTERYTHRSDAMKILEWNRLEF